MPFNGSPTRPTEGTAREASLPNAWAGPQEQARPGQGRPEWGSSEPPRKPLSRGVPAAFPLLLAS
jgi:hypothetical protein